MSEAPAPEIASFVLAWKNALTKVLTQLGAPNVTVSEATETAPEPTSGEDANVISANFAGGGCLKGQLRWTCEKTAAVQCAQLLASEPLDATVEFTAAHSDGFLEFLRQVAREAAVAWKDERGLPAELVYQAEPPAAVATQFTVALTVDSEKCKGLTLRLDLDAEICAALSIAPPEQANEVTATAEGDAPASHASNLDLILDVQLEATIRFGEREMLLQDVFGLMPGAVVELDQLVNEPAELLVAGRLVAKGEVVVVEGNFGLRVTEVVSRSQRAEMLPLE